MSCLWAPASISGAAQSAEAQHYSLACDQFSNGFARHCGAPNNRMWGSNWQADQTPSCAAPGAHCSGWLSNRRMKGGHRPIWNTSEYHPLTKKKKLTKNKRVGIYSENFCVIWVFFQCWPSFISEFLHVSEPQESARSATWFKSNNNECAAHILYTSTLSHHLRTAFISLQQRLD